MKRYLSTLCILLLIISPVVEAQHDGHEHTTQKITADAQVDTKDEQIWSCSMHPNIRLKKPGKCPICNMNLIPVPTSRSSNEQSSDSHSATHAVHLNEADSALMQVATTAVERKWVERSVRLVGKIQYDETRVSHSTAWVAGRVEKMFVDYTGITVRKGDHMVSLYSPELISAQEELIQAAKSVTRSGNRSGVVARSSERALQSSRDKLRLLGLTDSQIKEIERRGTAANTITIYAPIVGTVVSKHVNQGMYVETGTKLYTIADLSHLWLTLDAYESDLPWLEYGQKVSFSATALPGDTFSGVVSFIHPTVDEESRSVKVRVNVDNPSQQLKPGMFVTAHVAARLDSDGKVVSASFAGKFVCPMHPEIVESSKGTCPICGMDLVEAKNLPFVNTRNSSDATPPLVIPSSAPLITGKRAIVYVQIPDTNRYEAREVLLGARADDYYLVRSGLSEGELVVTSGAFKLDADLQIRGAKSMMNPEEGAAAPAHQH